MYQLDPQQRLSAWRSWKYRNATDSALPPAWFRRAHATSVNDGKLHYGEGIGAGNGERNRPFRFKGLAENIIDRCRAYGCSFTTEEGETSYRGVVFQLPAKEGKERYLAGCEWGESNRNGFDIGGGWVEFGGRSAVYGLS